jgi:hypothetical protein
MKRFLSTLLLLVAVTLHAADVQFNFSDFRGSVSAFANTNVMLTIKPMGDLTNSGTVIPVPDWGKFTNTTAGGVLVTGMFGGRYSCTISPNRTVDYTFQILVPDTNATLSAYSLRVVSTNSSGSVAYSTAASDSRYIRKLGTPTLGQIPTWNTNLGAYYPSNAPAGSGGGGSGQNSFTNGSLYGTVSRYPSSLLGVEFLREYYPTSTSWEMDDLSQDSYVFIYDSATTTLSLPYIKTAGVTPSRVATIGPGNRLTNSAVTTTELGYSSGVTQAIQTQINAKASTTYVDSKFTDTDISGTLNVGGFSFMRGGGLYRITETDTSDSIVDYDPTANSWRFYSALTVDGALSVITPTSAAHAVTKLYADTADIGLTNLITAERTAFLTVSNNFLTVSNNFLVVSNAHRALSNSVTANTTTINANSNSLSLFTNSFTGPTNTLTLNNNYQLYTASGNVSITNTTGSLVDRSMWTTLFITNASAVSITNWITVGRALGAGTTNIAIIASGKVGAFSFSSYGTMFTNYATGVQQ